MKSLFNFAIEYELVHFSKNPFSKMNIRGDIEKRKTLSEEQLNMLNELISNETSLPPILSPHWFIVCLVNTFRYTGIRRNQLVNLRICDINLANKTIILPARINKNHAYHEIPISEKLYPYLEELVNRLNVLGRKSNEQLFNFNLFSEYTRNKGQDMTAEQVSYIFGVLSKLLGFKVSPHRFRHTIATDLMKNVSNVYHVKQLLGHSDIRITLSYIEYTPEMIRDCVNSL